MNASGPPPLPWPAGEGEMANLIQTFEWELTPLGPMATWPARLRTAIDIMLDSAFPAYVWWGTELIQFGNDRALAFDQTRRAGLLAMPARDTWADSWATVGPLVERVRQSGKPLLSEDLQMAPGGAGLGEPVWFTLSFTPLRDDPGDIAGVFVTLIETTSRVLAEQRQQAASAQLRESEERQAVLLRLSDVLRPLTDPVAIQAEATRLIGAHLGVTRACYLEVQADGEEFTVAGDYHVADVPSMAGRYALDSFSADLLADLRAGHTLAVADFVGQSALSGEPQSADMPAGPRAYVYVPLLRGGQLAALLSVQSLAPRQWTRSEVTLMHETAERILSAIERAHGEAALRESEERLRIALSAGRMGTWRYNIQTGEQQWSPKQFEIFGLEPSDAPPTRALFLSLVHPEDHHLVEFGADDLRPEGTFLDTEFRILRPDGQVRWISAHALARFGPNDQPAELIGVNLDITDRKQADEALRNSEALFRTFAEASSDVLWIRGADDLQWEYLSPAFETIYGLDRETALEGNNLEGWSALILEEDREAVLDNIERVRRGERTAFEYRITRPADGAVRWLRNTDFPMRDEHGTVMRVGGIGHDLTELKAAEEHQQLLLAELQHRVRNTLGVIRSIARRTADSSANVEDYVAHLEGRIDSFARVQAAVTRNPAAGIDLAAMVADELRAYRAREGENLLISGPAVRVQPKAAESLGLAVHELATNAIKYGAFSTPSGRLEIGWELVAGEDGRRLEFRWLESGLHDLPPTPQRRGFGTEVLEKTLAYELSARTELSFAPGGLRCTISIPAPALLLPP